MSTTHGCGCGGPRRSGAARRFLRLSKPGRPMRKTWRYYAVGEAILSVDRFERPLAGLFLAEAEFAEDAAMAAFPHPVFALREVTADPRYTGGELVRAGVPAEPG